MVDKMRLEVILSAVDKATGPLKGIAKGSKATAAAIEEAQRALGKMEAEQRKIARLQDRLNSAKKGAASERDALRAAQANLEVLKTTGGATEKQIARQQASVDKQMAAYERQRNVALRLRAELNNMGVGKAAVEQAQLAARIATANAQIDAQRRKLDQQRHVEERLHALREKHGADMARMGMRGAVAAGVAMAGRSMVQTGLAPVEAFMQHEDAMQGVQRQVQGARDAQGKLTPVYDKVEAQIRELSGRLPQTTVQIAEMFTAAARMDVPTDKLAGFVEMASEIATAFDSTPGEMAESMGKIANNLKIPVTEIRGLADSINYLDDNAISKGSDIIGFLNRVSGVKGSIGITGQDMVALGSTLLTSGETEETAGTSIKTIFTRFAAATKGTKNFKGAVAEIGMTPEQLQAGMSKDAVGTLLQVAEAVKKLPKEDQLGVMAELANVEHVGKLAKLVNNTEELRRQIALANSEEAKGSMAREAAVKNAALSSRLIMASNGLFNLKASAGKSLKGAIVDLLETINPLVERLGAWMEENQAVVGALLKTVIVVGALVAAGGMLTAALMAVLGPLVAARFLVARFGLGLLAAKVGVQGAAVGFGVLGRAVGGLWRMLTRFPLVTIALGIATALHSISQKWDAITAAWKAGDGHTIALSVLEAFVDGVDAMFLGLPSAIAKIITGLWDLLTGAGWEIGKALVGGVIAAIEGMLNGLTAGLYATAKEKLGKAWDYVTGGDEEAPQARTARTAAAAAAMAAAVPLAAGAAGIDTYQPMVQPVAPVQMAPRAAAAPAVNTTHNNITIHAAPGMDEKAVGRAVTFELDRRERAKRSRVLSQLSDID